MVDLVLCLLGMEALTCPRNKIWLDKGDGCESAAFAQPSAGLLEVKRTDFPPHKASS